MKYLIAGIFGLSIGAAISEIGKNDLEGAVCFCLIAIVCTYVRCIVPFK